MRLRMAGLSSALLALSISGLAQKSDSTVRELSYCELAKTPQPFAGKRIRVRAVYKYGFEIQRLEPPACCPERRVEIWVEMNVELEGHSRRLYQEFPKGMGLALATFEGTFETGGPYGDGGCRLKFTVDKIEKLEGTAKPSSHPAPAWLPPNCSESNAGPLDRPKIQLV